MSRNVTSWSGTEGCWSVVGAGGHGTRLTGVVSTVAGSTTTTTINDDGGSTVHEWVGGRLVLLSRVDAVNLLPGDARWLRQREASRKAGCAHHDDAFSAREGWSIDPKTGEPVELAWASWHCKECYAEEARECEAASRATRILRESRDLEDI